MRDLNYQLKQLCRRNRDGGYAAERIRARLLSLIADQLHTLGFRSMGAQSLKPKHVEALVGTFSTTSEFSAQRNKGWRGAEATLAHADRPGTRGRLSNPPSIHDGATIMINNRVLLLGAISGVLLLPAVAAGPLVVDRRFALFVARG